MRIMSSSGQATFLLPPLIFPRYTIIKLVLSIRRPSSVLDFHVGIFERPHLGSDKSPVAIYLNNRGRDDSISLPVHSLGM